MSPAVLLGRRARAIRVVVLVVFVALVGRLVAVQELSHQRYAALSASELTQQVAVPAVRGGIYDRTGEVLAETVTKSTVVADPLIITHPQTTAARLAPVLGVPVDRLTGQLTEHRGFVYLAHRVAPSVAAAVGRLSLPGINLVPENQRVEPGGQLAQPVVGTVDYDGNGAAGLEYRYQRLLAGRPATRSLLESPGGVVIPGGSARDVAAQPGTGLELTLDEPVQYVAEQALGAEIVAAQATGGTAVVMDVKTGDILAMADLVAGSPGPATTADAPAGQAPSTGSTASAGAAGNTAPSDPGGTTAAGSSGPVLVSAADTLPAGVQEAPSNTAVTQVYEPGSVFKLVPFSAALQTGVVTPRSEIEVPSSLPMGTYTFHDAESHGTETLNATEILSQSSNIGTIEIAQRLGEAGLLGEISGLGFGRPTGLDFPGESRGLVPGPSDWTGTSIGSTPIGQDDAVTAQQLLDAYNAVADGGVFVAPRLVRGLVSSSGAVTSARSSPTHRVIPRAVDAELVSMLESVVSTGTGTSAAIDGYTVAGKTGTAQIPAPDHLGYIPGAYVGTFCGFAPAQDPVLSAVVVLDHPTPIYGGAVAAPVFSTIMSYALHHYGIPTTSTPTTASSNAAIAGQGSVSVPAGATTEGP